MDRIYPLAIPKVGAALAGSEQLVGAAIPSPPALLVVNDQRLLACLSLDIRAATTAYADDLIPFPPPIPPKPTASQPLSGTVSGGGGGDGDASGHLGGCGGEDLDSRVYRESVERHLERQGKGPGVLRAKEY
jgi:hypothetical protein